MRKISLYIWGIVIIGWGCQKTVDADSLLDLEERVSIVGYLSPSDTIIRIAVTRALPAIGTPLPFSDFEEERDPFLIKDAMVSLQDENANRVDLAYSEELLLYTGDAAALAIVADHDYFLKVVVDGREFNASCHIPKKVPQIEGQIVPGSNEFGSSVGRVTVNFQDFEGVSNRYIIEGRLQQTFQYEDQEPQVFESLVNFDPDGFITDFNSDGSMLSRRGEVFAFADEDVLIATLTLRVAHVEEALFQNIRASETNFQQEGNPFVEFSIAPNTFLDEGAVGIFAGYNLTESQIQLSE